ncbi:hypothetical protein [Rhizobium sp. 18065]|uniref:hypothetical protein n=1 Tax=Rhizobium sp. 18065 TaxID=2681411 RepID=UPI001356DC38|nr:hypothetical protein [Rhizobium sp. 18065]
MSASPKPVRAFAVLELGENTGGIIFARHAIAARKSGACEYSDGDITSVECRRAHWADRYADQRIVPAADAIAHGWRFECHGCGETMDLGWLYDNDLPVEGVIGSMDGCQFCCAECKERDATLKRQQKALGDEFIETLRAIVIRRFGNVEFCSEAFKPHTYVIEQAGALSIGQASLSFNFPGQIYAPATVIYDWPYSFAWDGRGPVKLKYSCVNGDKLAFEAFAAATKER